MSAGVPIQIKKSAKNIAYLVYNLMGSSFSVYSFLLASITYYFLTAIPGMTFFFLSTFSNFYLELYIAFLFGLFYPFTIPSLFLLILYGPFYPFSTWTFLSLFLLDFSIPFLYGLFYHFHFFLLYHFHSTYSIYSSMD